MLEIIRDNFLEFFCASAAVGVDAETLTTWEAVWNAVCDLVKNPYLLGCAAAAIIGVVVDPSTEGLKDRK